MGSWNDLSMKERADVMKLFIEKGIYNLDTIRGEYNRFAKGGGIHIKDSKKGTFTAAASRHNMGVQEFASKVLANKDDYSPAMVKKANFARNASRWKHGEGGFLQGPIVDMAMANVYEDGGNINPMNYEYRGTVYSDDLKKQGITHVVELPEVIVTSRNPNRPYVSSFNPFTGLSTLESIGENVLSGVSSILDGTLYNGLEPFIWAESMLTPTENEKQRKERIHIQNTEDRPYTRYIDAVRNDRRHEPSDPLYQSRLGLMGLVPDKNSEEIWHLKDAQGNYIKECAKFANHFNSMLGKPTAGDAWTTSGIYGDSLIYGNTSSKNKYPAFINVPRMLFKSIFDINRDNLETGDIVDLYNPGSGYSQKASREGRGNSHTGRIYKPEGKEGPTYIIHNVGGDVKVEPLGAFLSPLHNTYKITRIARPGTKDKPYLNNKNNKK